MAAAPGSPLRVTLGVPPGWALVVPLMVPPFLIPSPDAYPRWVVSLGNWCADASACL